MDLRRRYSRPTQVATHASLPSASARVHHIGADSSETKVVSTYLVVAEQRPPEREHVTLDE
jgi:hypothetical protein